MTHHHPMARNNRNILTNRIHDRAPARAIARYAHGRTVDIGCGTKPYAALLLRHVDEHVGVDHFQSLHDLSQVDAHATAYELPFDEHSFDNAVCAAVLEHLEEPGDAIRECARVLRPGPSSHLRHAA